MVRFQVPSPCPNARPRQAARVSVLNHTVLVDSKCSDTCMSLENKLGVTDGEKEGIGGEFDENAQPESVLQAYDNLSCISDFLVAAS